MAYDGWVSITATGNELLQAWLAIGLKQRNIPAYVMQEYCRPDRSFTPRPEFSDGNLLRSLDIFKYWTDDMVPIDLMDKVPVLHLGFHFSLLRADSTYCLYSYVSLWYLAGSMAAIDLTAIRHLDIVSNAKISQVRDRLASGLLTIGASA